MNFFIKIELGYPHDKDVYHYTKLSNLFGIITPEGLVFHAGRYDTMNDPNDSMYLTHMENHRRFKTGEIEHFGEFCPDDINAYLVSFSCSADNSLIWRLYDAEVCIHINTNVIYEHCKKEGCVHTKMGKVSYVEQLGDIEEAMLKMQKAILQPKYHDQLEYEVGVAFSFAKHKDYYVEDEWRISCFDDDANWSEIKVNGVRYNRIRLFRELRLPKECLTGITIRTHDNELFSDLTTQISLICKQYGYPLTINDIKRTKSAEVR